jgi:hypothetical protein
MGRLGEEKDRAKFQRELTAPPLPPKTYRRTKRATAAVRQAEGQQFMQLLNYVQAKG